MKRMSGAAILAGIVGIASTTQAEPLAKPLSKTKWAFEFGQAVGASRTQVPHGEPPEVYSSLTPYDPVRGYGFEPGPAARIDPAGGVVGPFLFSVRVPEGNYRVTVRLGGTTAASATAIKAESRRVMTPLTKTVAGETATAEFTVHVRTPRIDDRSSVSLSAREKGPAVRHWDNKLTLEFCGPNPAVASIDIGRVDDAVTVFLAGDSTVSDQPQEPWAAWGQWLPQFFTARVAVANYAESGRSLRSFKGERRWDKLLSQLKAGDYVLIQFGHNDMKEKGDGVGAFSSFSDSLRAFVQDAQAKGGRAVLLTPMHRRRFSGSDVQATFGDYPDAVRKVATELKVPLINLQAMSKPLYEAFGPERSKQLFVHFPAGTFPGQTAALKDDTHFSAFGADQLARCVVQGIRDLKLPLADDLRDGIPTFDPTRPGDAAAYDLPASAAGTTVTPEGR